MKSVVSYIVMVATLFVMVTPSFGQAKLKKANKLFCQLAYNEALTLYLSAVEEQPDEIEPDVFYKIGLCYIENDKPMEAEEWFGKSVEHDTNSPGDYLLYAQVLQQNERYGEATKWYKSYSQAQPGDSLGYWGARACESYIDLMMGGQYLVENVSGINSSSSDISPTFFDNKVIFSSDRAARKYTEKTFKWTGGFFYNNFESIEIEPGELGSPELIEGGVNSKYHDGIATLSADGHKMIFTKTHDEKKKASEDCKGRVIYNLKLVSAEYSQEDGDWEDPSDKPFVNINNKDYNVAHPSLSSDGSRLYFVSDNPDFETAQGGADIYVTKLNGEVWSAPVNVGIKVNSVGQEVFPFIYNDSILYYSSNSNRGNGGLGGLDIYYVKVDTSTGLALDNPKSMGWPINSSRDDFGFIAREDDKGIEYGYFSSSRTVHESDSAIGRDDIYFWRPDIPLILQILAQDDCKFDPVSNADITVASNDSVLDQGVTDSEGGYINDTDIHAKSEYEITASYRNQKLTESLNTSENSPGDTIRINFKFEGELTIKGIVLNSETANPLIDAEVSLQNASTGEEVGSIMSDESGHYDLSLMAEMEYYLIGYKLGYLSDTVRVSTVNMSCETIQEDLHLSPGRQFLTNVYYYFDKANISKYPENLTDLDALVAFLNENPTLEIEVRSHTDSRGSAYYNQALAQRRAQAVKDYLIDSGIDASRLTPISYGEYCPTNDCKDGVPCNEVEYQRNRRTEVVVTNNPAGKVLKSREKTRWVTGSDFYVEGGKYGEQGKGSNWREKEQFQSKHGNWRNIKIRKDCDEEQAEFGFIIAPVQKK